MESELKYQILKNSAEYNALQAAAQAESEYTEDEDFISSEEIVESRNDTTTGINFINGSSVGIDPDFMALRIEESNTFLEKENFEIVLLFSKNRIITLSTEVIDVTLEDQKIENDKSN